MLQKHSNGTYYFRYIIPKDLQNIFNTKGLLRSLKTRSKKQADMLYNNKLKELEQIIYYIRSKVLSEKEINLMIEDFKKNEVSRLNTIYTESAEPQSLYDFDDFEENIKIFKSYIQLNDYTEVDETIQKLLEKFNIDNYTKEQYNELGRQVCLSYCGLCEYMDNLIQGNVKLDDKYSMLQFTSNTIINNVQMFNEIDKNNLLGITLGECWDMLFDHLINIKKLSNSSIKDYQSAKKYLNLIYDDSTDIGIFTKKFFRELQITYTKLPTKTCSSKKYANMTIKELTELDEPKLNNKTTNKKFSCYKVFFDYLEYTEIVKINPVDVNKLPEEESPKVRYEDEDLQKIFNTDFDEKYKKLCKICLYSGMRIGELLLLKKRNIITIDGKLFIEIKRGDTKIKNQHSIRKIPIHSNIIRLITDFKETVAGNYLFYDLNITGKNIEEEEKFVTKETNKMNKLLNKIITDKDKTFHSFRKSFTSKLYDTSPEQESFIKVLVGHSVKNNITLSVYGNVRVEELIKMVEKVEFELKF